MCIINGVVFPLTHIRCKRLPMIIVRLFIIRRSIFPDKLLDKRIRAGSIIGRIGQCNNILISADGEALNIPYLINILLGQLSGFHADILAFSF